jgi:hypothetical protein
MGGMLREISSVSKLSPYFPNQGQFSPTTDSSCISDRTGPTEESAVRVSFVRIPVGPNIALLKSCAHTRLRHSCKASSTSVFAKPNLICVFRLTGSERAGRVQLRSSG